MEYYKGGQQISEEILALLVKKAFSCKVSYVEREEIAHTNAVYLIGLSTGKRTVLKVGPFDDVKLMHYEKNMMYTEVSLLQKMRNYTTIEVPEMYYYDASQTELNAEYFFMEYMDGDNYRDVRDALSQTAQAAVDEEIGRNNRAINSITGSSFGYYGRRRKQRDNWFEAFSDMMKDILDDAKYYNVQLPYSEDILMPLLDHAKPVFDEVRIPRLVHCDLWDDNVFIKSGRVQGIIDWERAIWGDALMERAFRTNPRNDAFFRGYGTQSFSDSENLRINWYRLYSALDRLTEYYATSEDDERRFAAIWHALTDAAEDISSSQ